MISFTRVMAIAHKEWRLNSRFLVEYLATNLVSPIKTAILMYVIYAGFLGRSEHSLGNLNGNNFQIYVLLGTTLHSLLMTSVYIFRAKMVTEKWWQTVTATLVSPVSTIELILGFILGSGSMNLLIGMTIFTVLALFQPITLSAFLISLVVLAALSLLGFGIGLIGGTIALCWEGKTFLFDYGIQAFIFLSCFYYPIQTLPSSIHSFIQLLPTYHAAQLVQDLYLTGSSNNLFFSLGYLFLSCAIVMIFPPILFERSIRKYGIVGY